MGNFNLYLTIIPDTKLLSLTYKPYISRKRYINPSPKIREILQLIHLLIYTYIVQFFHLETHHFRSHDWLTNTWFHSKLPFYMCCLCVCLFRYMSCNAKQWNSKQRLRKRRHVTKAIAKSYVTLNWDKTSQPS